MGRVLLHDGLVYPKMVQNKINRVELPAPVAMVNVIEVLDVYARFYSCRQCWASKCRGL